MSNLDKIESSDEQRLIYIKKEFIDYFEERKNAVNSSIKKETREDIKSNNYYNSSKNFKLLTGKDEISQDIATILMLADLLEMSVRKDSIRSIL